MNACKPPLILVTLLAAALFCACSRDPQKAKQKYLESGAKFEKKAQYGAAIVQYRNALTQDPNSADTLDRLAEAYLANRQPREAYAALMQAVAVDPNRTDVRLNLGRLYLGAGDFKKAEEQATLIVQKDPNNAAAQQVLGASLAGQQQSDKAIQAFEKAAQLSPKESSSFVNLGISYASVGNRAEAERNFQKAIETDPRHAPAWLGFAALLRRDGQLARAEQTLQTGLDKNPDDLGLHLALADLYLQQSKTEPLEALLRKLRDRQRKPETAIALGDFFTSRNRPERAVAEYQWGAGVAPGNLELKARLVEQFLNAGKVNEAEKWNAEILKEKPRDVRAGIARGRILLAQGRRDEAATELRQQVSQAGDSAPAHYYLGLAHVRNMNSAQAKAEFQDALRLDAGFLPVRLALAELQMNLGELAPARETAEGTVRRFPNVSGARTLLASVLLRQRDPTGARQQLAVARDLAPRDPSIPLLVGATYVIERKTAEAQREYEAALKIDPNYGPAHDQLSALWLANGQSAKAVDHLQQQAASNPKDAQAHFALGSIYRQKRDFARAEAELNQAVQLAPDRVEARLQLGGVFQDQSRLGAAIEQFEAALKIEPRSSALHAILGTARLKNGEPELARKHFEQGLSIDPNSAVLANNLAVTNAALGGNLDGALALAQKARELAPDLVNAADTLGWIQYKKGLYPSAVQLLEECVRKTPDSAVYRYHLGMALIASGDRSKGRTSLDAALRLNLTGDDAAQARQALEKMR
jgi:tetratricopeptide (TPR) repeat protein